MNIPAKKPVSYAHAVVALLDIVGFGDLVKKSRAAARPLKVLDALRSQFHIPDNHATHGLRLILMSDTVVYLVLTEPDWQRQPGTAVMSALSRVASAQMKLLEHGILLRGGLTRGHVHFDDSTNTVVGPALCVAHEIESRAAVFPRVAVDPALIDGAASMCRNGSVIRFSDGIWFVNYLRLVDPMVIAPCYENASRDAEMLEAHKKAVLGYMTKACSAETHAKCAWLVMYHNVFAEHLHDRIRRLGAPKSDALLKRAEEARIRGGELAQRLAYR